MAWTRAWDTSYNASPADSDLASTLGQRHRDERADIYQRALKFFEHLAAVATPNPEFGWDNIAATDLEEQMGKARVFVKLASEINTYVSAALWLKGRVLIPSDLPTNVDKKALVYDTGAALANVPIGSANLLANAASGPASIQALGAPVAITSTSYVVVTGLSLTITPNNANSVFLYIVRASATHAGGLGSGKMRLQSAGTTVSTLEEVTGITGTAVVVNWIGLISSLTVATQTLELQGAAGVSGTLTIATGARLQILEIKK